MEFPHLMRLMEENQFDTIYHEHFSYFSFSTAERVFEAHQLTLFDVEEISMHGGSLRIFGRHSEDASKPIEDRVRKLRVNEGSVTSDITYAVERGKQIDKLSDVINGAVWLGRSIGMFKERSVNETRLTLNILNLSFDSIPAYAAAIAAKVESSSAPVQSEQPKLKDA